MEEARLGHTQGQVSSGTCDAVSWGARGQEAAVRGRVNAKQKRLSLAGESSQVWRGRAWAENGEAGASQREGRGCHPSVCVWGGGDRNPAIGGNIIWAANVQKTEKTNKKTPNATPVCIGKNPHGQRKRMVEKHGHPRESLGAGYPQKGTRYEQWQ